MFRYKSIYNLYCRGEAAVYDLPTPTRLEGKRLDVFAKAGQIAKVPLYAEEWNVVARKKFLCRFFWWL
jgi:hypothetical protein